MAGVHAIAVLIVIHKLMYDNMHSLQVVCGLKQYNYLITHNVSSDQSPITVNRTNVTLYGVKPEETYTVEITPYVTQNSSASTMSYFATATVNIKSPVCTLICQRGKQFSVKITSYDVTQNSLLQCHT